MSDQRDSMSRAILPSPDRQHVGLTTFDAKDPDTRFPPIQKDGEGRIDMTTPMIFSGDETCDIGKEGGSPVSPEERFTIAMARQ
jgi:hypothetical protein